ncbi:condensation domain-containing protein, partial [Streptomyces sparsus]
AVAVVEPGEGAGAVGAELRELLDAALDRTAAAVPDDEPFLGMGLDSLVAVDLAKELERRLGRELPSTLFFEYRTVRELAAHLTADAPTRPEDGARAVGSPPAAPADPGTPSAVPTGNTMDVGEPFALTPVQLAFHISGRLHRDVAAFAYVRQTISGPLRADLLEHALGQLAERHPMLRLRMQADGPTPRQWVAPPVPTAEWFLTRDPGEERLVDIEEELCNRLFDLGTEPPVRAVLLRETPDVHQLLLVLHHSAGDGYSLNVLGEELWTLYTALCQGRAAELPPLEADFARFADALTAERASAAFRADRDHWQVALASHGAPARLHHDGDPDAPPAPPLACHQSVIPTPLLAPLRAVAAAHGVSLFHLLLAAYTRCLSRWSGQTEIAVNVARAGREMRLPGIDRIVGPLADTLPVLARVDRDEAVPVLAERLRLAWLESERHARLSSLDLARLLPATAAGPRSVGTAGFSFARFPAVHTADCPVTVRPTAAATASAATRLGLLCWEEDTRHLRLSWNYPGSLFDRSTVRRLADDFLGELARLAGPHPSPTPAAAEPSALAEAPAGA